MDMAFMVQYFALSTVFPEKGEKPGRDSVDQRKY